MRRLLLSVALLVVALTALAPSASHASSHQAGRASGASGVEHGLAGGLPVRLLTGLGSKGASTTTTTTSKPPASKPPAAKPTATTTTTTAPPAPDPTANDPLATTTPPQPLLPLTSTTAPLVAAETSYIESCVEPGGAIAEAPGSTMVNTYLASYGAQGLARDAQLTGDTVAAADAWNYLRWYQGEENSQGWVDDYVVDGATTVQTIAPDSTDATSGMYLVAADDAWAATHDVPDLQGIAAGITGAVHAIEEVQDTDGLTFALPGYHVKYLMDESEAYGGLRAAAVLANALADPDLAVEATVDAERLAAGVATLWDPATDSYDWAKHGTGSQQATAWGNLYPDGLEEMWAVAYGVVPETKAQTLLGEFEKWHPAWDSPTSPAQYLGSSSPQPTGYQPVVTWALAALGGQSQGAAAATSIEQAAQATGPAWPYTVADAGGLIIGASGGDPVPSD